MEFLMVARETIFPCWLGRDQRNQLTNNSNPTHNSLMIDSSTSSSNGVNLSLFSSGMQEPRKVAAPNTNSANRTLYNAGLSQKIFRMSSFLTNTRLPLCSAIMFGFCFIAACAFSDRTAIVIWFFFVPTSMIWYSASGEKAGNR
jgi:hypothetical protein